MFELLEYGNVFGNWWVISDRLPFADHVWGRRVVTMPPDATRWRAEPLAEQ